MPAAKMRKKDGIGHSVDLKKGGATRWTKAVTPAKKGKGLPSIP